MKKLTALVVDDEVDMCWALEKIIQEEGIETHSAYTAQDALNMLKKRKTLSLVFVDIRLPDMNGLDLARTIRLFYPQTFIILISGYYYKDDPVIKADLGDIFIGFIEKPFDLKEIRQMLKKALPTIEKIP
jgi:DNA-binding NtrC family response regulator